MRWLMAATGALWAAVILWDAFEAIVLPRRVTRRFRPTRTFYRVTWVLWSQVVDLAQVLGLRPFASAPDRLPPSDLAGLQASLAGDGILLDLSHGAADKLTELRIVYEPYVEALSAHLLMPLPPWRAGGPVQENWRTSVWGRRLAGATDDLHDDH